MNQNQVARMIDLSAVRSNVTTADVKSMVEMAKRYRCICVTTLPCYTALVKDLLDDTPGIHVSGNVAFPSGGATSKTKIAEAQELLRLGCDELDMVIHIGLLRSGHLQRVLDDIRGVVQAAGETPVKVILECHYLSDEEIRQGCELCIQAGAAFVKTGTGWAPTGATLENVALIKSYVGEHGSTQWGSFAAGDPGLDPGGGGLLPAAEAPGRRAHRGRGQGVSPRASAGGLSK